ncbi:Protein CBG01962 [Caenorhabditis briggsae]|uniref:Protein CBG01962 n=1 Tax=Caenorhabditis briggsae TaxID=6238 RepID=A8WRP4_CAEBR|nr:Protein CBG01962 [Caenorhabditis briggsae]CAP23152.1 Protein CBG01962 [Caenorhabditis briggsae]
MAYTSYFEALEECQLSSLEYRRLYNDLVYTYKIIVSNEIIMEVPIFEIFNHTGSLRRHKYYLKSLIKNSTKISSQFLSNRVIRCWTLFTRRSVSGEALVSGFQKSTIIL